MYIGIKHFHSFVAWLVLIFILLSILYALYGWLAHKPYGKTGKIIALLGLISSHIQVLFGIVLHFLSPLGISNFSKEAMGNSISRLYVLEHPVMMILGVVLITIGYSKAKKTDIAERKYKLLTIFYSIGFVLILSRLPWHLWL